MTRLSGLVVCGILALSLAAQAQTQAFKRGSYRSFTELKFEDNSIFIEEAFNQQMGSIQYISTAFIRNSSTAEYSFTAEIPITDQKHQLSYTLSYLHKSFGQREANGFGDLSIGYRYQIFDQSDWLMLIPRVSVILPTGSASLEFGNGAFGLQTNIALTKRVSNKILFHYNVGLTEYFKSDCYSDERSGRVLLYEDNLFFKNVGGSVIWHASPVINFTFEYTASFEQQLNAEGGNENYVNQLFNPAVRFSILTNNIQIVPALSFPFQYAHGLQTRGMMLYLSIETNYQ